MQAPLAKRIWDAIAAPFDGWLMAFLAGIFVMSMLVLFSASNQSWHKIDNKLVYTVMALTVMWIMANARPQTVMNFAPPLYAAGVLLLVGVELFGITVNGSTRWLNLGIVRIQPSEIMKTALPMTVSYTHLTLPTKRIV